MTKKELDEIKQRVDVVKEYPWLKQYASDEMIEIFFSDIPKLLKEVEERSTHASSNTKGKKRRAS